MPSFKKLAFPGGLALVGASTKRKAQAGFVFVFVCLVALGVIAYCGVNSLRNDADLSRHTEEVISSLRLMLSHVTDAESTQTGFVITGDESYLAPCDDAKRNVDADLQFLRGLMVDNTVQQQKVDALAPLVAQRMVVLSEGISRRREQGFAAAQAYIAEGPGKQLHDQIRGLIGEMVATEQGLLQQRQADTKRSTAQAKVIITSGSLLALGVVITALFALGKDYTRRRTHAAQAVMAGRLGRVGSWTVELPAFRQTWSDEVCAIHEMPSGTSLTIDDALRFYAPECRETISRAFGACVRDGTPYDEELQIITGKGRRVWVRAIGEAERDASGVIRRVHGALQDISARRQGVEDLRESEARFRELAENIDEVFWISDPKSHRKIYISPAYETIWGRTCRSAYDSQRTWLDAVHAEDRDRVLRSLLAMHDVQGVYEEEYRIIRPDGTERWIRDRAYPVKEADGAIKRWVGVAEDITQYRAMQEQFRQAQKMEAIGTLAGGIAHDFNNILASILGYTELSRMILTENPKVRDHLGAVLQATGRAIHLVRQILTFSRQQPLERRTIQLQPIVKECMELLRASIPSMIEFEVELAPDAPTVLADVTQIHQVLMNLGTNASHAMKGRPGRLQVKLENWTVDDGQAAKHPQLRPGLYARLSVGDNGSGMDQKTQRRLFEPFFTTKPLGEGTGLGLAVVHGIMNSHDGAITVESRLGEGTTFHLYFPRHTGEATMLSCAEGPVPRGHGERLLFIDDEALLIELGRMELTELGYEVTVATQPAVALAMVRADPQRFSLVITDLTMPVMNGLMLADQLKEIRPGLPIILTTGYRGTLTHENIEKAGIAQILIKPTGIHSLGTAVHAALAGLPPDYGSRAPY